MLPSPAVVTMNSELQVLQKYLFPDSLANSIPLIVGLSHYSFTRWGGQPESAALSPLAIRFPQFGLAGPRRGDEDGNAACAIRGLRRPIRLWQPKTCNAPICYHGLA